MQQQQNKSKKLVSGKNGSWSFQNPFMNWKLNDALHIFNLLSICFVWTINKYQTFYLVSIKENNVYSCNLPLKLTVIMPSLPTCSFCLPST